MVTPLLFLEGHGKDLGTNNSYLMAGGTGDVGLNARNPESDLEFSETILVRTGEGLSTGVKSTNSGAFLPV